MTDKEWERYVSKQMQAVKREPDMIKIRKAAASLKWFMRKMQREERNAELAI